MRTRLTALVLAVFLTGCMSLDYDLSTVDVPISAKPATAADGDVETFSIRAKDILWVHGLAGRSEPDVEQLVNELLATGGDGSGPRWNAIAGFRVKQSAGFHEWLVTHLTLTLVRMKTVVIEGQLIRER